MLHLHKMGLPQTDIWNFPRLMTTDAITLIVILESCVVTDIQVPLEFYARDEHRLRKGKTELLTLSDDVEMNELCFEGVAQLIRRRKKATIVDEFERVGLDGVSLPPNKICPDCSLRIVTMLQHTQPTQHPHHY